MFAYLRGTVADRTGESVTLDVNGVGYLVQMPLGHLTRLSIGDDAQVHVHTYVREDQIALYGFVDAGSRKVFGRLLGVNKVGPKLAMNLLSTFTVAQLRDIAMQGNTNALKKVSGVGKKTAQRLALELEGLVDDLTQYAAQAQSSDVPSAQGTEPLPAPPVGGGPPGRTGVWSDLRSALIHQDYPPAVADQAVAVVRADHPDEADLSILFRHAVAALQRR